MRPDVSSVRRAVAALPVLVWGAVAVVVGAVLVAVVAAPLVVPDAGGTGDPRAEWPVFLALVAAGVVGTAAFAVAEVVTET